MQKVSFENMIIRLSDLINYFRWSNPVSCKFVVSITTAGILTNKAIFFFHVFFFSVQYCEDTLDSSYTILETKMGRTFQNRVKSAMVRFSRSIGSCLIKQ